LDDKIDLNVRMNETLESMARALFKSWFIDFDPVRAKAAGCETGLPKPVAELFPDSFEATELGAVPKGWRVRSLDDLCLRVSMGPFGSDIKTDNFVAAGVPVVRGGNLTDGFVDDEFVYVSEDKANELRNANAFPRDIVITHRGTLGQVGIIPRKCRFPRYVVSQSQMVLSVDPSQASPEFVFNFLCSRQGQHQLLANTSQTGVPAIARPTSSVKAIQVVSPPTQVLRHFDKIVEKLSERRNAGWVASRTLSGIRDSLLPRLMSGELRIEVADRIVGAQV
jgi:type I restriction enzyme S subunit